MNKQERAKRARHTVQSMIPFVVNNAGIALHPSIKYTIESLNLLGSPDTNKCPVVSVWNMDTLEAARVLGETGERVAVLNMCSVMQPGGGFMSGALAQEESLCMRSTLYPCLDKGLYPLTGSDCLFTPSVLVFRDPNLDIYRNKDQFFIDVISCAAPRKPPLNFSGTMYRDKATADLMASKMRLIMGVAALNGRKTVVLGALGCGAYDNPPVQVASLWKSVLTDPNAPWNGKIDRVVFAILDGSRDTNLSVFQNEFK